MEKIVDSLPFADRDMSKMHVTFLSNIPDKPPVEKIMDKKSDTELVYIAEKAVYLYCPDGYGKTVKSDSNNKKLENSK